MGFLTFSIPDVQRMRYFASFGICQSYPFDCKALQITKKRPSNRRKFNRISARIVIDRRRFFNDLLLRQQRAEVLEAEVESGCPIHCVREVYNYREFKRVLDNAQQQDKMVIVDFHDTACGICKQIYNHFIHICKEGFGENCSVDVGQTLVFVKHNVRDHYDELTDLARFYQIRTVPTFVVFMDGCRVQQFSARNTNQLAEAISQLFQYPTDLAELEF